MRHLKTTGITLILVSAVFLGLEAGLRWGANYYLRERAKLPLRIGRLFINPATSRATLAFEGEDPHQKLTLDLGAVRFDWWMAILKRLRLGNVHVDGLNLDIQKDTAGVLTVGGIRLAFSPPAATSGSPPAENVPPSAPTSWKIGTGAVDIQNVHVHYRDPLLDVTIVVHHIHIDPAESWHPNVSTPFDADIDINGGRLLLKGICRPFQHEPTVETQIQLTALPLEWLTPLVRDSGITALAGTLGVQAKAYARLKPSSQETVVGLDGTIEPRAVEVQGPAVGISRVSFDGVLALERLRVVLSSGPMVIQAQNFEIRPESRAALLDRTVRPVFHLTIFPLAFQVKNIDSADAASVASYTLSVRLSRFERIDLNGRWAPFAPAPDGNADLKIDGLNLTAFSPYTQKALGYRLQTGLFDLKTKADVRRGLLQATNGLVAHKLHFEKLQAEELDESSKQIGLPLNLCLALIRDSDDNIRLDVPLEGNLQDPQTPIGKLVWTLLGKALVGALRAAVTAFFPSGTKIGFDPVAFAPGQAALTPAATAYLAKVGEKLAQRPEVSLKLSGLTGPVDWYALTRRTPPEPPVELDLNKTKPEDKDKLLALAGQRADALRGYLADTFHIDPKRLLETAPQLDPRAASTPRAEISLSL
jgi:outer membrane protein OmpA-like peptidoglycan-associated protein